MQFEQWEPNAIEAESMRRLRVELEALRQADPTLPRWDSVAERCLERAIHCTADFEMARLLYFTPDAIESAFAALRAGAEIVTDTQMAASGISQTSIQALGCRLHCFMRDPDLAERARELGMTRSRLCMERGAEVARESGRPLIYVVGNAPTALERIHSLVRDEGLQPALVIAAPVGFVNVLEGKALIEALPLPSIIVRGRKGGSNLAAALMNALLYSIYRERY